MSSCGYGASSANRCYAMPKKMSSLIFGRTVDWPWVGSASYSTPSVSIGVDENIFFFKSGAFHRERFAAYSRYRLCDRLFCTPQVLSAATIAAPTCRELELSGC